GRAAWREPGIHSHRVQLFGTAGGPLRLGDTHLWLWIPGSRFARPGMTDVFRFHEFVIRKSEYFACAVGQITGTGPLSPCRHEGRFAIVTKRGAGCDGRCGVRRARSLDVTPAAYGEVVWSWRRDRGVYPPRLCGNGNGDNQRRSPGRVRISRQTL